MNDNKVDTRHIDVLVDQAAKEYGIFVDGPERVVPCAPPKLAARKPAAPDMVHQPPHYKLPGLPVEVIDVRSALLKTIPPNTPYEAVTSWNESWTYITRMWGKNGLEDAKKGLFYLQRMIAIMEGKL